MKTQQAQRSLFEKKYSVLEEETILDLNRQSPGGDLNSVVVRLQKECFGLFLSEDPSEEVYHLFYVTNENKLEGRILELTIKHPNRDAFTFAFADELSHTYNHLDTLDIFNTYQIQTRSLIEKLGYYTINPEELKTYDDPNPLILVPNVKGIIRVPVYDKLDFYKLYFNQKKEKELKENEKFIYIMLNKRNNLFKIGSSKNPFHRERTLQSQEPEIEIIALWDAPLKTENELHKQYSKKRKRGEWFNLSLNDLRLIKERMSVFN